jgi:hypothetical protein
LTAEDNDYDAGTRWMGYYPSVTKHSEAVAIEIKAGAKLADVRFAVQRQSLFTVRFRIVTPDGSPVPWESLGVAIDSPDRDPLAYHESHGLNKDGSYTLGLIPPGHYFVSSFVQQVPVGASKWQMAKEQVDIKGDMEVLLRLIPKK